MARAGGDAELRADLVPGCAEHRSEHRDQPVVRLGGTWVSCARVCVVAVGFDWELFAAAFSKHGVIVVWEGGKYGNL